MDFMRATRYLSAILVSGLLASACHRSPDITPAAMNTIAEQYVRLTLQVGQHDPDYVDAYYGPPEWKPAEKANLDELRPRAAQLLKQVGSRPEPAEEIERLRQR